MKNMKLCECGCGQPVKNRFVNGHNNRGKHPTEETRKKMSISRRGSKNPNYGKHHTLEVRNKISESLLGKKGYWKGKKLSEEHKQKIGEASKERSIGKNSPMFGKPPSKGAGRSKGSYCKKGHYVRSTWERAVADWLFDNDIDYDYEPERFVFNSRISYLPDFYILQSDLYIEVKGYMRPKNKIQHKLFGQRGYNLLVIGKQEYNNFKELLLEKVSS